MIVLFVLRLIVGLGLTWCLLPRRLVTSGFFRIQLLVTLGLSVLLFVLAPQTPQLADGEDWLSPETFAGVAAAIAGVSFVGSALWILERRRAGTVASFLVLGLSAALMITVETREVEAPALAAAAAASAAWLVGGTTCAMLLGHWYLTAAAMSLVPLQRAIRLAQGSVALQLIVALTATALADDSVRQSLVGAHLVWTLLRWLAGVAAPLVLLVLARGTLRYRNTQAATGVLFAAVILVFIGQAAALLLANELGWPL
jgi:hypothetical protein